MVKILNSLLCKLFHKKKSEVNFQSKEWKIEEYVIVRQLDSKNIKVYEAW